jgi:hypothetical protein
MIFALLLMLFTSMHAQQNTTVIVNKTAGIVAITTANDDLTYGGMATSRTILKPNQYTTISDQSDISIWFVSFLYSSDQLIHHGEYLTSIGREMLQQCSTVTLYNTRIETDPALESTSLLSY